jgi:ATP-dependent protease HslVU (ClpYQ) peptidase subunit
MYRVRRDQTKIEVTQSGEIVYSGDGDDYVVFKESADAVKLTVKKIRGMTDPEILLAMAGADVSFEADFSFFLYGGARTNHVSLPLSLKAADNPCV